MESPNYLHGFDPEEQERLYRQARFLEPRVFEWLDFSGIESLLEVGCGVGAQTEILLRRHPHLRITAIDRESVQLERAIRHFSPRPELEGRLRFLRMDAQDMAFGDAVFDGAFLIWILEHVASPVEILREIRRTLKPGGTIQITEVQNGTLFVHPDMPALQEYWTAYNRTQRQLGGDPFVGAKLGNLLAEAGFKDVQIHPHFLHFDRRDPASKRAMFEYWRELMLSGGNALVASGSTTVEFVKRVQDELAAAMNQDESVFFYVFVQARAKA